MATNPYPGVNAHYNNTLLDLYGGWSSFHGAYIIDLSRSLKSVLPTGYYAAAERSLQVTALYLEDSIETRTRPDISIFSRPLSSSGSSISASPATATLPLWPTVLEADPENWTASVGIFRLTDGDSPDKLVTRIELLSPANKPGGSYFSDYRQRREQTLLSGVSLVEIDLIAFKPPVIHSIPAYSKRQPGATPYHVLVSRPYPSLEEGEVIYYAIPVDSPLPRLSIPLIGTAATVLDLQMVYNITHDYDQVWERQADYTQPPQNFHRYTEADQARIRELMAAFPAP